jgi:hypothetical protein
MPEVIRSFSEALTRLSRGEIQQAGQRYTPGIDPKAPNLRIESLISAIDNVACGEKALTRFQSIFVEFSEAWDGAKHSSQRRDAIQTQTDAAIAFLSPMMDRLRARDGKAGEEWSDRLAAIDSDLSEDVSYWRAEEAKLQPADPAAGYSPQRNSIRDNIISLGRCLRILREEREYLDSAAFKVLSDPRLLINGEWGTGKTHLMCDVTLERIDQGKATVLVLAKSFQNRVIEEIAARIDPALSSDEVFDQLEALAIAAGERALIIVDGVNEGRRKEWKEAVSTILERIAGRSHIGLIVTCRTPFESIALRHEDLESFNSISHTGFDEQEFDAQAAFFQYYNLPLPEVPLLDREFSRPLTLKLICQSLENLTSRKLLEGFAGIASGQKGMTYILESFVNRVGESLELEFGLPRKGCWVLLKGANHIGDPRLAGFAPCMATKLRAHVLRSEADRIIAAQYPSLKPAKRRALLEALRTSGLVEEDVVWYSARSGFKSRIVLRLPYQRFSDHLIARHLLKAHLDVSSPTAIIQSFAAKSPLSKIFRFSNRNSRTFAEPGLAQALITEFPERVGTKLQNRHRELIFVLPKRAQKPSAYFEPFIEGIFWRDPKSFTEGTRVVINHFLASGPRVWERMVDALAAVSTKPKHPYHARRLYDFLAQYSMADRDLAWSEYLRQRYKSPTIHRLLSWAEKLNASKMSQDSAKALAVLLSLVLTTVVRKDRDLATKALVSIGEKFPDVLFNHVVTTLEFNDPYVPERMLAAAYGTTLSLVDSDAAEFRPQLGGLATSLYRRMFGPRARHATHHTLTRDYALGIIEMALYARCVKLPRTASAHLTTPFPSVHSTFASDGTPDPAVQRAIGHAINMDFGNYTIGRLIRNRANYDHKNPEYVRVRSKIERRMFDLGYREERFKIAESEIGYSSTRGHDEEKVDRYGKKYSWIAYFEMWGERVTTRSLPDWRLGERTSDCGVDPSFPKRPPAWAPPIPDLFGDRNVETEAWVGGRFTPTWNSLLVIPEINGHTGDWVLVEGFVNGVDESVDRELFTFLRGVFVARRDVDNLKAKFLSVDYPGNDAIPAGGSESYLYAGEVGRRKNYARHLRKQDGRYRRQIVEAFDRYTTLRRIPGIKVELPSMSFGWESYHSLYNDFSGFDLPAPRLIQRFGLATKNREIDFYDSTGKPGTLYREAGGRWKGNRHSLFYVRADLLRRYLTETRQVLVWCNWGERDWLQKKEGHSLIRDVTRDRIYQAYSHVHRSFSRWSAKDSKVV